MSAGAVESVRVAASRSDAKVGELLRSSGENKRKKKKSKPIREEEKADVKAFSGSFADYLTHLQEDEEERDHRKLNEKLKKAAALEAKKKAELDSALSFIDGQLSLAQICQTMMRRSKLQIRMRNQCFSQSKTSNMKEGKVVKTGLVSSLGGRSEGKDSRHR